MARARILLVEDESIIALDIKNTLERLGIETAGTASTGRDAIRMAEELDPDLILMDIALHGDMDGIEAARTIRKCHGIPVIYLTANADPATVERARDTDPCAYLSKPINDRDLYSNIDSALHRAGMERKLRESELKYRDLIENINDVIFALDENGILTFISPPSERITGYTVAELVGRHFLDFVHPEDRQRMAENALAIMNGANRVSEYRIIASDGRIIHTLASSRPLFANGRYSGLRGVLTDITLQKLADIALVESEEKYRLIFNNAPLGIYHVNADGVLTDCNNAFAGILGTTRDVLIGIDMKQLPDRRVRDALFSVLAGEGVIFEGDYTSVTTGKTTVMRLFASPIKQREGKVIGGVCLVEDITAQKLMQDAVRKKSEELEAANEELVTTLEQLEATNESLTMAAGEISASEEKFAKVFHNSANLVTISSIEDGAFVDVNEAFEKITGFSKNEALGRSSWDLVSRPGREETEIIIGRLKRGETIHNKPILFMTRGGELRHGLQTASIVTIGGRKHLLSIINDITSLKRTQEELLRINDELEKTNRRLAESLERQELAEDRFFKAFHASPVIKLITDIDTGHIMDVNEAFERHMGYGRDEVVGRSSVELRLWPDGADRIDVIRKVLREGRVVNQPQDFRTKSGSMIHTLYSGEIVRLSDNRAYLFTSVIDMSELKKVEAEKEEALDALRESEQRYRLLTETSPDIIFILNTEGKIEYMNPAGTRLMGLEADAITGSGLQDIFPPDQAEEHKRDITNVLESGNASQFEHQRRVGDRDLWLNTWLVPLRDTSGTINALLGISRDMTGWKKAEELVRENEKRFSIIFDRLVNVISVHDGDMRVRYVTPSIQRMMGYTPEEFGKLSIFEQVHPDDLDTAMRDLAEVMDRRNSGIPTELRARHADGHWVYLAVSGINLLNDPHIKGIVLTFNNISERHKADLELKHKSEELAASNEELQAAMEELEAMNEELVKVNDELRESDERLRTILRNTPVILFALNRQGIITLAEGRGLPSIGLTEKGIAGRSIYEVFGNAPRAIEAVRRALDGASFSSVIKIGERVFETLFAPVRDHDEKITGTTALFYDITEREKVEESLRNEQRLESIGMLAGGIAHDFNNLLTGIFGYMDLARISVPPGGDASGYLANAMEVFNRAKDLTQQLLTFSKGEKPVKKTVTVGELLKNAVTFVLSGSNIKAEFEIDRGLWHCDANENQITQVIDNIVINARQAMPHGGTIRVSAGNRLLDGSDTLPLPPGKYVWITIADQGQGIARDVLPRIFDPFFTTRKNGSGLGLAICYSIIKKHDGHISAGSEAGKGTVFTILLPSVAGRKAEPRKRPAKAAAGAGRLLVLDDESAIKDITGRMLHMLGYDAEFASEGREAIEKFDQARKEGRSFDALILDLTIPGGLGGSDALRVMQELDPAIKAIATSGYSIDPVMTKPSAYGFSDTLVKPFTIDDLSAVLGRIFKK